MLPSFTPYLLEGDGPHELPRPRVATRASRIHVLDLPLGCQASWIGVPLAFVITLSSSLLGVGFRNHNQNATDPHQGLGQLRPDGFRFELARSLSGLG
jgi:hypothetical protein